MSELQWAKLVRALCFVPVCGFIAFVVISILTDQRVRDYMIVMISPMVIALIILSPVILGVYAHVYISESEDKEKNSDGD